MYTINFTMDIKRIKLVSNENLFTVNDILVEVMKFSSFKDTNRLKMVSMDFRNTFEVNKTFFAKDVIKRCMCAYTLGNFFPKIRSKDQLIKDLTPVGFCSMVLYSGFYRRCARLMETYKEGEDDDEDEAVDYYQGGKIVSNRYDNVFSRYGLVDTLMSKGREHTGILLESTIEEYMSEIDYDGSFGDIVGKSLLDIIRSLDGEYGNNFYTIWDLVYSNRSLM